MIHERLVKKIEEGEGYVAIMAGSGSDDNSPKVKEWEKPKPSHVEKIIRGVELYNIPYGVHICSAHKQSDELEELIQEYNTLLQPLLLVAVAGGTDALSGTASWDSQHPVLSCPPDAPNTTCLTNPPGSSNAYIANASNVGKFAAQMFSHLNPEYAKALDEFNAYKINSLKDDDIKIGWKYLTRLEGGNKK